MKRKVIFRADANSKIGRGHLSRCLAVAEMLKSDFEITIITLLQNKSYIDSLEINFPLISLNQENDIFDVISKDDILWLDGYLFTEDFKKRLQSNVYRLIETNDIPYQAKNIDVIFNHTPGIKASQFGETSAQLYLGLKYVLLRPSFLEYAKKNITQPDAEAVFVCFGGADNFNLGFRFVKKLISKNFKAPIYLVTNQNLDDISLRDFSNQVNILKSLKEQDMMQYMLKSKVLLIPSSVLSFEAIALRKPFFTGYFVDNQKLIFEGLKEMGLAECYGYLETDEDVEVAYQSFLAFYENTTKQQEIEHQYAMLDGNSGNHIKNVMLSL